jgi:hypothetical protein
MAAACDWWEEEGGRQPRLGPTAGPGAWAGWLLLAGCDAVVLQPYIVVRTHVSCSRLQ